MKICIIGAGNLGFHLGNALHKAGLEIIQVYSRSHEHAMALATPIGASPITDFSLITTAADLYILAVKDDAIGQVAEQLSQLLPSETVVVHTSGATSLQTIARFFPDAGVFYPLQTFSKGKVPNFRTIPFCLEASTARVMDLIKPLAVKLSDVVHEVSEQERAGLHVGAVMVNNFVNHLWAITEDICQRENIQYDLLKPLIIETLDKALQNPAGSVQTGPARRFDQLTIDKHLAYLGQYPQYQYVYKTLSDSIIRFYSDKG